MREDTGDFQIPDGPPPRPFLDFLVQGGVALVMLVVLVQGVYRLGQFIGPLVPFAWEKQVSALALKDYPLTDSGAEARARREVIQRLVDQLAPYENFPQGMTVTIHYSNQQVVNAFATLGGNIVVYEGLIERLPSENALSMVLAHEMSHVKHRDAIRGIGADQLATLIIGLATGDSNLAGQIVSNIQLLTSLQFSRDVEERSDRDGLAALFGHYGHVNGYLQTFDALEDWIHDNGGDEAAPPEFLRDHPDTATRKLKLADLAERNHWPTQGPLTPLRQANFLPHQKFGPWGPPAESGPATKGSTKDSTTNYEPGSQTGQPTPAPGTVAPPQALAPDAPGTPEGPTVGIAMPELPEISDQNPEPAFAPIIPTPKPSGH